MGSKRPWGYVHGRRVYADSGKSKELSPSPHGAVIVYFDNVDPFAGDWDPSAEPVAIRLPTAAPNDEVRR